LVNQPKLNTNFVEYSVAVGDRHHACLRRCGPDSDFCIAEIAAKVVHSGIHVEDFDFQDIFAIQVAHSLRAKVPKKGRHSDAI